MSGSHYANAPAQYGAYFSAAPESTVYDMPAARDLRTMAEREADDVAALTSRVEALETTLAGFIAHVSGMTDAEARAALGAPERTPPPVVSAVTEARFAALEAVVARHADVLQVLVLESEARP